MKFFKKRSTLNLEIDLHSHLIPGIDDGAKTLAQSIEILSALQNLGYKKVITTPHIHPNYPNTPDKIKSGLLKVKEAITEHHLTIEIEAAAEYFVDESFLNLLKEDEEILSFGDQLVLVESSFQNKPIFFEEALFELKSKGYTPVLAHPERYRFLEGSIDWLTELKAMGVLMQVTLGSLGGYYGDTPRKVSKELLKNKMVDFLGSDLHKLSQIDFLKKGIASKEVQNYLKLDLCRNNQLF